MMSIDELLIQRNLRYARMGLMLLLKDCDAVDCSVVDAYAAWLRERGVRMLMLGGRLVSVDELPRACRDSGDACIVNKVIPLK